MASSNFREKIIDAGMKALWEKGFNATSVQDITTAAGVPKGSFYNHFESKEALGAAIVEIYGEGEGRALLADATVAPLERLRLHFERLNEKYLAKKCRSGCLLGNFSAEMSDQSPLIRERLLAVFARWTSELEVAIRDAQETGAVPTDLAAGELAAFLFDAYEGAILRSRVEKTPRAFDTFMKVAFTKILA